MPLPTSSPLLDLRRPECATAPTSSRLLRPIIILQMGWTYRADFAPLFSVPCSNPLYFTEHHSLSGYQPQPPRAPRMRCVPLPPTTPIAITPTIFPLELTADLSYVAPTLSLMTIPISLSIHVHNQTSHIGNIFANPGAQTMLEIIEFAQRTVRGPLDLATYQSLSMQTKTAVEGAFIRRVSRTIGQHSARQLWTLFINGHYQPNGPYHPTAPCGADLLLGNTNVWGLDTVTGSGVGCLHVA